MGKAGISLVVMVVAVLLSAGVALTQTRTPDASMGASSYIVVFEESVEDPGRVASDLALRNNLDVGYVYRKAVEGFSAEIPDARIDEVRSNQKVAYVELDREIETFAQRLPWGVDRVDADRSSTLAGNGSGAVSNVNSYVIDTGIDAGHADLNVVRHVDFAAGPNTDCNGHGTHVAGTLAARDNTRDVVGVAPGSPLIGVKVFGCDGSGTTSDIIRGVEWVTANAMKPAVANMSLGGLISLSSPALDEAVRRSAASGVFYSVAAGNDSLGSCFFSPARAGKTAGIMTTAATDRSNREASFSNSGACVDIWAPGVDISSTKRGGGTISYSGTSMAAPHVGGAGALYLSKHPGASPASVERALKADSVSTGTLSKDGSRVRLLNADGY